jgi:hypothetical protein
MLNNTANIIHCLSIGALSVFLIALFVIVIYCVVQYIQEHGLSTKTVEDILILIAQNQDLQKYMGVVIDALAQAGVEERISSKLDPTINTIIVDIKDDIIKTIDKDIKLGSTSTYTEMNELLAKYHLSISSVENYTKRLLAELGYTDEVIEAIISEKVTELVDKTSQIVEEEN